MTKGQDTRILEAARSHEPHQGLGLTIHQHATWSLENAAQGAAYAQETKPDTFYARWGNPTVQRFEDTLATLEHGDAALATASGMGAIATALIHHARERGKHVITQTSLYSATQELLNGPLNDYDVETTALPAHDTQAFQDRITDDVALVYLETPSNPLLDIADIQAISDAASDHDAPVIVDNTFATPINQNPLLDGADIVLHSTTKAIGGHSDATGGALVADQATIEDLWGTYKMLGPTMAPNTAFLMHRGIKTLGLRAERQNENATALARFLDEHPRIETVHHPSLPTHPGHEVAKRQMHGYGGLLSFEVEGGYETGKALLESTEICMLGVSLGGVETLIQHPASMTHAPLPPHKRREAGIQDGLIRLSCGIENTQDLITDLERSLEKATGA